MYLIFIWVFNNHLSNTLVFFFYFTGKERGHKKITVPGSLDKSVANENLKARLSRSRTPIALGVWSLGRQSAAWDGNEPCRMIYPQCSAKPSCHTQKSHCLELSLGKTTRTYTWGLRPRFLGRLPSLTDGARARPPQSAQVSLSSGHFPFVRTVFPSIFTLRREKFIMFITIGDYMLVSFHLQNISHNIKGNNPKTNKPKPKRKYIETLKSTQQMNDQ